MWWLIFPFRFLSYHNRKSCNHSCLLAVNLSKTDGLFGEVGWFFRLVVHGLFGEVGGHVKLVVNCVSRCDYV